MATPQDRRTERKPQGRMICAWCGRVIGPSHMDTDSHGICSECEAKLRQQAGLKEAR